MTTGSTGYLHRPAMAVTRLTACGEALYGPRWQRELARDLGVNERTMRRWVAGDSPVPTGLSTNLLRLITRRAAVLREAVRLVVDDVSSQQSTSPYRSEPK